MRKFYIFCFIILTYASPARADNAPLDYFLHSYGPASRPTMFLGWVFAGISVAVCVIVTGLLLGGILRKRPAKDAGEIISNTKGLRWITIGTAISTAVLFAMAIYAMVVLNKSATPEKTPGLTIIVTGYDWWWKVEYENTDSAKNFETANEIHIPVGVPVLVKLKSADVIHAFWVPQLAGKTEMIPGLTNQQWLEADIPGIYHGKCTQFCGIQHAHMDFEVIAQSQADFEKWENAQLQPQKISDYYNILAGQEIFMKQCSGCHTVRGTQAMGTHAPDLTHLKSRRMIAAGLLPATGENIMDWVEHAQELKPGARMPDTKLNREQAAVLSAYLESLK